MRNVATAGILVLGFVALLTGVQTQSGAQRSVRSLTVPAAA